MEFTATANKILQAIKQANNILVVGHQQPDADAVGSMVAVASWLKALGKPYACFCKDQPSSNLIWLSELEKISSDTEEILAQNFDAVILVDSGDLEYAGVSEIVAKLQPQNLINIDHHATNKKFGTINLVDAAAVSTTTILFKLFKVLKVKIDPTTASAMLAGIIFDTYNFTNPNTNQQALTVAAELLAKGASLPQVSDSLLKTKSIEGLKVWGKILMRLSYNKELGIATTVITDEDLAGLTTKQEVTEGVANFLNNLTGVKAALILQQLDDHTIKGSLRTNEDDVDVAEMAKMFGGGGHKKAAGFRLSGKLVQTSAGDWQIE